VVAPVSATIPDEYVPLVVKAPFAFTERVFDLTPAVELARRERKPLFIYLGAADCPPCVEYKHFLTKHREELRDAFSRVVLVDIRTWIRGPAIHFTVDGRRYTFDEFKAQVGDVTTQFTYPYFWFVSADLKQLRQLPRGSRNYLSVESQVEVLRIPDAPQK
jgi:hypothetical protein